MAAENEGPEPVKWADGSGDLTIETTPRTLKMVRISHAELESLSSSDTTIEVGLLGISMGGLLAFGIVLLTVQLPSANYYGAFAGLAAVSFLGSVYFGWKTAAGWRRRNKRLKELKGEAV